jgi:hypothetical protein
VAREFSDDAKPFPLCALLDGMANVADSATDLCLSDTEIEALPGNIHQMLHER